MKIFQPSISTLRAKRSSRAFTILEITIVVILVGVLVSLALPRFFSLVEYSRATEALSALATVRGGLERYYVSKGLTYAGATTSNIDTGDPLAGQPNAHFAMDAKNLTASSYVITATRNSIDGGTGGDKITLTETTASITRSGTTHFAGVN